MNPPVDAGFVMKAWLALEEMRAAEGRVISGYLSRLGRFAEALNYRRGDSAAARAQGSPPRIAYRPAGFCQRAKRLAEGLALAPALLAQIKRLRALQRENPACITVLAIASSRLPLDPHAPRIVDNLAYLVRTLSGSGESELAGKIAAAEGIVLFDPLAVSGYWKHRQQCWRENVQIVDGTFLLALAVWSFIRSPWSTLRRVAALRRQCASVCAAAKARAGRRALWCALFAHGYDEALGAFSDIQALFFTSNSTLTELLRAYLIQCTACRRVFDIMHGIGSQQAERFYSALLHEGQARGKATEYRFIPQVPSLPLFGIFRQRALQHGAINAHLNRFVYARRAAGVPMEAFVESEGRSIWGERWDHARPLVVTVLGTFEEDFFSSPSFKAECLLIGMARETLQALRVESTLLYIPHPLTGMEALSHPVFAEHEVRMCRYSVFSWLVSDISVSLLSSAMFEATYFGSRAFTPLAGRDGLYTPYLGLVGHANSDTLDDTVRDFRATFTDGAAAPRLPLREKAAARLAAML